MNIRFATAEQLEWIKARVAEIAATEHIKGCKCKVEQASFRVAMEYTEKNKNLLDNINAIFAQTGLPKLGGVKRKGGSDAADVTTCGIPCVDSIGVSGGNIHSLSEFANLESLRDAAKRVVAIAQYI